MLTIAGLCKELAITRQTLNAWVKRGCPVTRRKAPRGGGRKRLWFDIRKVRGWMKDNAVEYKPPGQKAAEGATEKPPPGPPAPQTEADRENLHKSGIIGALSRLRSMERVTYAAFARAILDKETAAMLRAKEGLYIKAAAALAVLEEKVPIILEGRGDSIPLETVVAENVRIDQAIKADFLALPRKLAPILAQCGDKPAEIEEILTREIDDAMRHLASGRTLPQ